MRWQTCGSTRWSCWAITPSIRTKSCVNCSDVLGNQAGGNRYKPCLPQLLPNPLPSSELIHSNISPIPVCPQRLILLYPLCTDGTMFVIHPQKKGAQQRGALGIEKTHTVAHLGAVTVDC